MKHRASLMVLPLLFLVMMISWIEIGPALHAQQLSVSVTLLSIDKISMQELDFENFHSTRPFIMIVMTSSRPTTVVLHIVISAQLADGTLLNPLAIAVTEPFLLSGTERITNVDLGAAGSKYQINEDASGINHENGKKVNDVLQATGNLPFGIYTFNSYLESVNGPRSNEFPVSVVIQNPSRVELLSPSNSTEWPNTFPVFQWSSNTDEVILGVYEKLPGMQTPQEAISGVPQLQTRLGKVNTFQYPPAGPGVRQLEPGKSYYWYVRGVVRTGSNTEELIPSEIWQFTITNQIGSAAISSILRQLEDIAGPQFQPVIAKLIEMGFEPTGLLRVGGLIVPWAEFLQRVRSGEFQITGMTID
jgi:hypothetical protein